MERLTHRVFTDDGIAIIFDLYRQADHGALVIICPGFFQSKDTATFQRLADALAHDRDILCMDFRGHGHSSGLYTFSTREGADLEAVLDWAKARYQRLGVIGFSLGAAIALNALSRDNDKIRSLVAVSAPCAFEEIEFKWWTPQAIRTGLQGLEPGAGCRLGNLFLKKARPIDSIRQLFGVSILLIHGTNDPIVHPRHSRKLYEAAPERKRLELIEGGGHAGELYRRNPTRFLAIVQPWLEATLGDHGARRIDFPSR